MTPRSWLVWNVRHNVRAVFETRGAAEQFAEPLRRRHAARFVVLPLRRSEGSVRNVNLRRDEP
jgi:hypothetical protein